MTQLSIILILIILTMMEIIIDEAKVQNPSSDINATWKKTRTISENFKIPGFFSFKIFFYLFLANPEPLDGQSDGRTERHMNGPRKIPTD